jgi:hypothetical protein
MTEETRMSNLAPIHREIVVTADPDRAFTVWTEKIGQWWPIAELSVHGAGGSVAFEDGAIVEWDPGCTVAFTWHPGRDPQRPSRVRVTFAAVEGGTRVMLEHDGWESFADPSTARTEYGQGWPGVLAGYARCGDASAEAGAGDVTWVAASAGESG